MPDVNSGPRCTPRACGAISYAYQRLALPRSVPDARCCRASARPVASRDGAYGLLDCPARVDGKFPRDGHRPLDEEDKNTAGTRVTARGEEDQTTELHREIGRAHV